MRSTDEFHELVMNGDEQKVREALAADPSLATSRDDAGVSAILKAAYSRRAAMASLLADAAGNLDIFEAAALGRTELVAKIAAGDPSLVNSYNTDGFFPLVLAVFFGHADTASALLGLGANVNQAAQNQMNVAAIHAAAAAGHRDVARRLLALGANPDAQQQLGYTALHSTAHSGDLEFTKLLVESGADLDVRNDGGKSALELATEAKHEVVARYLRAMGASE